MRTSHIPELHNEVAQRIWEVRYRKNEESLAGSFDRVANALFPDDKERADQLYNLMVEECFYPAGRVTSNAGLNKRLTLNNCFTLGSVPDSMEGIFDMVKIGAITQKAGGGTGYDFSTLRPNETPVTNDSRASGPVSFMSVFNQATATIMQSGRRGANMGVLNVYHPDILEFVTAKSHDSETLKHFNISVIVDNEFLYAVQNDEVIHLHFPVYDENCKILKDPNKWTHDKAVKARDIWNEITSQAYNTGEPGVLFYDNMNKLNNTAYCETILLTNPCAEFLGGIVTDTEESKSWKGACNLGSIILSHALLECEYEDGTSKFKIDWECLKYIVDIAVRSLDAVIDINYYPHIDFKNYQDNLRTVGLGITGLADMMILLGVKYGSRECITLTHIIMDFIARCAYQTSIELAKEKGSFPMFDREKFIQSGYLKKQQSNFYTLTANIQDPEYKKFFESYYNGELISGPLHFSKSWDSIIQDIKEHGIRNARLLSVAPTGTMSLTFGNNCSSGLEPIYKLEDMRKIKMEGQKEEDAKFFPIINPVWKIYKEHPEKYKDITEDLFVTAHELSMQQHVDMLNAVASHIDMSCSKTINAPAEATLEEFQDIYLDCWKMGLKGCTVFRSNPLREGIFASDQTKVEGLSRGEIVKVCDDVIGRERHLNTGCGTLHFQAYFDPKDGNLLETYASRGSQGGCNSYMVSLSRMTSLAARGGISTDDIIDQLLSAPPCIAYNNRAREKGDCSKGMCCANAMGYALKDMKKEVDKAINSCSCGGKCKKEKTVPKKELKPSVGATKCPDCGEDIIFEGGCNICKSCGWSKCG